MITDSNLFFSNAQAITSGAVLSTNVLDIGKSQSANTPTGVLAGPTNTFGVSDQSIVVNTGTVFAGGTSVKIEVLSSDASDMSSPVIHSVSDALLLAELTANTRTRADLRLPVNGCKRYVSLRYTATGTFTTGTFTAFLAPFGADIK